MRPLLTIFAGCLLAACGGGAQRSTPPPDEPARLACDRFAARAIQAATATQAADLAALAAQCYQALDGPTP